MKAIKIAEFTNKEDGLLSDVTEMTLGYCVRLKDTDAELFLDVMKIFKVKADAIAFAKMIIE